MGKFDDSIEIAKGIAIPAKGQRATPSLYGVNEALGSVTSALAGSPALVSSGKYADSIQAAKDIAAGKKDSSGGIGGLFGATIGKSLEGIGYVLGLPARTVTSVGKETVDFLQGEGFNVKELVTQPFQSDFYVSKFIPKTGNKWLDIAVGLGADILTDPVTWVAPTAVMGRAQRIALASKAGEAATLAKAPTLANKLDDIVRYGEWALDDVEREVLNIPKGLRWQFGKNNPVFDPSGALGKASGMAAQAVGKPFASVRATIGDIPALNRVQGFVRPRSYGGALNKLGRRGQLDGVDILKEVSRYSAGIRFRAQRGLTEQMLLADNQALLNELDNSPFRDSVFEVIEGTADRTGRVVSTQERELADRIVNLFQGARDEANKFTREFATKRGVDADYVGFVDNYFHGSLTDEARDYVSGRNFGKGKYDGELAKTLDIAPMEFVTGPTILRGRTLKKDEEWLGEILDFGDKAEINRIARDELGFDWFKTDARSVVSDYIENVGKQTGRIAFIDRLFDYGTDVVDKLLPKMVPDGELVAGAKASYSKLNSAYNKIANSIDNFERTLTGVVSKATGRAERASARGTEAGVVLREEIAGLTKDVADARKALTQARSKATRKSNEVRASFDNAVAPLEARIIELENILKAGADREELAATVLKDLHVRAFPDMDDALRPTKYADLARDIKAGAKDTYKKRMDELATAKETGADIGRRAGAAKGQLTKTTNAADNALAEIRAARESIQKAPPLNNVKVEFKNTAQIEDEYLKLADARRKSGFSPSSTSSDDYMKIWSGSGRGFANTLRKKNPTEGMTDIEKEIFKNRLSSIDSLFDESPPITADITTYRGITLGKGGAFDNSGLAEKINNLKIGDTYTDSAYMSTSLDAGTAARTIKENGVLFQIEIPSGSKVMLPTDGMKEKIVMEAEVTLPRNSQFVVTGIGELEDGTKVIRLSQKSKTPTVKQELSTLKAEVARQKRVMEKAINDDPVVKNVKSAEQAHVRAVNAVKKAEALLVDRQTWETTVKPQLDAVVNSVKAGVSGRNFAKGLVGNDREAAEIITRQWIDNAENALNQLESLKILTPEERDLWQRTLTSMRASEVDLAKVAGDKNYANAIINALSDPTSPLYPRIVNDVKEGWAAMERLGVQLPQETKDMLFNGIEKFGKIDEVRQFLKIFDRYNQFFRVTAMLNPGFVVRNAYTAAFNNFVYGVTLKDTEDAIRFATNLHRKGARVALDALPEAEREIYERAYKGIIASGAGQIKDISSMPITDGIVGKLLNSRLVKVWGTANSDAEVGARMAMALRAARNGENIDGIATTVARYHFDYSDLSKLDEIAKTFVPFWTFASRNIPLQIMNQIARPSMYRAYESAKRNMPVDESMVLPSWLAEREPLGFGAGAVLNPDLPQVDMMSQVRNLSDPLRLLAQLYPQYRLPVELAGNRQLNLGIPFSDKPDMIEGPLDLPALLAGLLTGQTVDTAGGPAVTSKTSYAVTSALPTLGVLQRLLPQGGGDDKYKERQLSSVLGTLTGAPYRQVTQTEQENELIRRQFALRDFLDSLQRRGYVE